MSAPPKTSWKAASVSTPLSCTRAATPRSTRSVARTVWRAWAARTTDTLDAVVLHSVISLARWLATRAPAAAITSSASDTPASITAQARELNIACAAGRAAGSSFTLRSLMACSDPRRMIAAVSFPICTVWCQTDIDNC